MADRVSAYRGSEVADLSHPACVYVFGEPDGVVKVGMSTDLRTRLCALRRDMRHGRLLYFRLAGFRSAWRSEHFAHQMLAAMSLGGEWYALDAEAAITAVDGAFDTARARPIQTSHAYRVFRLNLKRKAYRPQDIMAVINGCAERTGIALRTTGAGRYEIVDGSLASGVRMEHPTLSGGPGVRMRKGE